jgi:hypothetical protein
MLENDYQVFNGQMQVLGRYDYGSATDRLRPDQMNIAPEQCALQVAPDGSRAILHAMGTTPTGWRTRPDEAWNWLQPGQQTVMQHHWKITMDYNYPEQAVWKLADGKLANSSGPCWDYVSQYQNQPGQQGGQQGGYGQGGQQGGYY